MRPTTGARLSRAGLAAGCSLANDAPGLSDCRAADDASARNSTNAIDCFSITPKKRRPEDHATWHSRRWRKVKAFFAEAFYGAGLP